MQIRDAFKQDEGL